MDTPSDYAVVRMENINIGEVKRAWELNSGGRPNVRSRQLVLVSPSLEGQRTLPGLSALHQQVGENRQPFAERNKSMNELRTK